MTDRTAGMLGLMRRAQALEPGEDRASAAVKAGKAKLLLLSSDLPEKARERAESYVFGRKALLVPLPYTKEELGAAIGLKSCQMAAVTDLGFSAALMKGLEEKDPEAYGQLSAQVRQRLERAQRRKQETAALKGSKRSGKRRT